MDHGITLPARQTMILASLPQRRHSRVFRICRQQPEAALRHYLTFADGQLWGRYGFVDAFAANGQWISKTYLAVNQGPIVAMIENHRSGLLWDLFMDAPEIKRGLERLGIGREGALLDTS
jgi:hypothetical protein